MTKGLTAKERILKEHGLVKHRPNVKRHSRFVPELVVVIPDANKTPLMRYLEQKYGCNIESLLISGSLATVAKRLGNEVDVTTLSKWIKRFKLRYTADNLPQCKSCTHFGLACQSGVCYVLVHLGLYNLLPAKKREMMG